MRSPALSSSPSHILLITELAKIGSQEILRVLKGERSPLFYLKVNGENKYMFFDLDKVEMDLAANNINKIKSFSFGRLAEQTADSLELVFSKIDVIVVVEKRKKLFALYSAKKIQKIYEEGSIEYQAAIRRELDEKGYYH